MKDRELRGMAEDYKLRLDFGHSFIVRILKDEVLGELKRRQRLETLEQAIKVVQEVTESCSRQARLALLTQLQSEHKQVGIAWRRC